MTHRDEAIYARSDARGGITLTAEEARLALTALGLLRVRLSRQDPDRPQLDRVRMLAARLEAASTTPSP